MAIRAKYLAWRKGLTMLSGGIFIAWFFVSIFFTTPTTQEQESSFVYNLAIVLFGVWVYASFFAKLAILSREKFKLLNIIAIVFIAAVLILPYVVYVPSSESKNHGDLYFLHIILTYGWVFSWVAIDVAELVV